MDLLFSMLVVCRTGISIVVPGERWIGVGRYWLTLHECALDIVFYVILSLPSLGLGFLSLDISFYLMVLAGFNLHLFQGFLLVSSSKVVRTLL